MKIREATVSDARDIFLVMSNVEQSGFMLKSPGERNMNEGGLENYNERLNSHSNSGFFVAEIEGVIAGYLILKGETAEKIKHRASLVVGVHSDYRKRGIAKSLFEYVFGWAKENGIAKIELTVMVKNKAAYDLYTKLGFVIEGVRKNSLVANGIYIDEFYMAKHL